MRHLRNQGTMIALFVSFLVSYLVLAPMVFDISLAQSMDTTPPILAHHPIKVAYRGKPLKITVRIGDESKIQSVKMIINYDGKTITGAIPPRKGMEQVPLIVRAKKKLTLYSKPGQRGKLRGEVEAGEELYVTGQRQDYYRIKVGELTGYVKASDTELLQTGRAYGVALPAKFTNQPSLSYQIIASDIFGNTTSTDLYTVRLLTKEEVAYLRSRAAGSKKTTAAKTEDQVEPEKKRSFKALWIFSGLVLAGGGVYYYMTQKKDKTNKTTAEVVVEWK